MNISYRPEIDGLRALAVILVIIYHANFVIDNMTLLPGGYLGVDVFFVISGYLITLQILKGLNNQAFSFRDFYIRRARRLLPVLYLVMFMSFPFSWRYLLPDEMKEYSGSVISSLLFVSNFWFAGRDNYHTAVSWGSPFLHTWSLSIEEQFYLIFPPILFLLFKFFRKNILQILIFFFLLFLIHTQLFVMSDPSASFYLFSTRSWELFSGCILAVLEFIYGRNNSRTISKIMTLLGLSLIICSASLFNTGTPHPSFLSLAPVMGTALLIWFCQKGDRVTSFFSNLLLVKIGLMSYSLYLWHHPVFTFAKLKGHDFYQNNKIILIFISVLLSSISFFTVETLCRNRKKISDKNFVKAILASGLVLAFGHFCFFYFDGIPKRFGALSNLFDKRVETGCHNKAVSSDTPSPCVVLPEGKNGEIILLGDSHANVFGNQIKNISVLKGRKLLQNTQDRCPFFNGLPQEVQAKDVCYQKELPQKFHEWLNENKKSLNSRIIIWHSRLPLYFHGKFDNKEGGIEEFPHPLIPYEKIPKNKEDLIDEIIVENFGFYSKNSNILIIIYPVPEVGWNVPRMLIGRWRSGVALKNLSLSTSFNVYKKRAKRSIQVLDKIRLKNVRRIYPGDHLCSEESGRCHNFDDRGALYYDDDHLSNTGIIMIMEEIKKMIN